MGLDALLWDRKTLPWDRKTLSWDRKTLSRDRKTLSWDRKALSRGQNFDATSRQTVGSKNTIGGAFWVRGRGAPENRF